jgi:ATP-dependent RNA helicase SUPV3L1/SUV3
LTSSPSLLRRALALFTKSRSAPSPAQTGTPAELAPFLKRHAAHIGRLGMVPTAKGFSKTGTRQVTDRGVSTALQTEALVPYRVAELTALKSSEAARAALKKIGEDLSFQAAFALTQAEGAIKTLVDFVLRDSESQWLGGEAAVRSSYLSMPASIAAGRALTSARKLYAEAAGVVAAARIKALDERLRRLTQGRLDGKRVVRTFTETLPFRSIQLELKVQIDKTLTQAEAEGLLAIPEASLSESLDGMLQAARKGLLARVADQLKSLSRQISSLPHVDLLTDEQIAETVAPYYGGLDKALKKRRAKSALVAVEERAREAKYQDDVVKFNAKRSEFADVSRYYPLARSMKRELVLYVGPTNSGKTWRSLNDLAAAESGAYLAPLRLLALEGQEELEKRGKATSFITGEERDIRPDAQFVSSTIEMLNIDAPVGAVVIDEVQLLADERRGWAWLAAVVGAPASRIIMTGSPDCVEMVKDLATYLGEPLTIHECTRHNELRVAPAPMRLREVRPGMAIVCFSRRDVLRIKTMIQENSDHKVAVVYGNLSPQARREEARRFRSGEADILVATDAIAMGLNLPVSEVLFYTTTKFNGEDMVTLGAPEIRQIGGRAGRYGFANFGVVNALNEDDLDLIREAVDGQAEMLPPTFYVAPGHNHIRIIGEVLGTTSLERILTFFERAIEFSDPRFLRSNIDDLSYLSSYVDERLPFLDVKERLTIACAPVPIRIESVLDVFLNRMLPLFRDPKDSDEEPDYLDDLLEPSPYYDVGVAKNQFELRDAEDYLKMLTVYAWLAYRYPEVFTRIDDCEICRDSVNGFIERSLRKAPEKRNPEGGGGGSGDKPKRSGKRRGRRRGRR